MISMKLPDNVTPEGLDGEIQYTSEWVEKNQMSWSPTKEIKMIKEALKQDHLYNDEELRKLKTRLRHMMIVRKQLKRGPGFGRAS